MDAQRIAIARNCMEAGYAKTMDFPQIVGALMEAGFESYTIDYRRNTATYFLADSDSLVLDCHPSEGTIATAFDQAGIAAQIKWAQANPPDYSYPAFCKNVKASGCAGYMVSFSGRRALYFGRTAETHIEHFPQ